MSSLNKEIINAYKRKPKHQKKVIQLPSALEMIGSLFLFLPLIPIVGGGPTLVYCLLIEEDVLTTILWALLAGLLTALFILFMLLIFISSSPQTLNIGPIMFVMFSSYIICYAVQFTPYAYNF